MLKNKDALKWLFLVITIVVFFGFGFYHLTKFVSFDEHYWLYNTDDDRIHKYWKAMTTGDWIDTRINDKPGITLAYTSGLALLFQNEANKQIVFTDGTQKIFDPAITEEINFLFRLPILLISGFFSIFFFWIIKKITQDAWVALWSSMLILLSPVLIGISQIVNPDSLFWILASSSIFSFLYYLKSRQRKFAVMTTAFFGLTLATKYVGLILIPFFFYMALAYYLFEYEKLKISPKDFRQRIIENGISYFLIVVGSFLVFSLMMPAVFVRPKYLYEGTIGFPGMKPIFLSLIGLNILILLDAYFFRAKVLNFIISKVYRYRDWLPRIIYLILVSTVVFVLINWITRHRLIDLSDIPFDTKRKEDFGQIPYFHRFILEFVPLVFALTPPVLFSLLYLWIKSIFVETRQKLLVFLISSFFLIFYAAVIKEGLLVTIRYSIVLFPLSMVLSAIAIKEFFSEDLKKIKQSKYANVVFAAVLSAIGLFLYPLSEIEQNKLISERELRVFYNFHRIIFFLIIIVTVLALGYLAYRIVSWKKLKAITPVWLTTGIVAVSLISLWQIKPYYFSYTNRMLPQKYIITGGWGYGGYEAAQFMNQMPNAKEITVWTDSYGFCEFFVGKCIHKIKVRTSKYPINYFYSTLQSQLRPQFIGTQYKEAGDPIWELNIDNRYKNYVRIYKAQAVENQ